MKNTKRARRRQDLNRMKARARRIYPHDRAAKSANHLKVCSCWMCGNPRRQGEVSFAEQRVQNMDGWQSGNAAPC